MYGPAHWQLNIVAWEFVYSTTNAWVPFLDLFGIHLCTRWPRSLCSCGSWTGLGGPCRVGEENKVTMSFKLLLESGPFLRDSLRPFHYFSPLTHILDAQLKRPKNELCQQSFQTQSPVCPLAQSHGFKILTLPFGPGYSLDTASQIICPEPWSEVRAEATFFRYFSSSPLLSYILKAQVGSISIKYITYLLLLLETLLDSFPPSPALSVS